MARKKQIPDIVEIVLDFKPSQFTETPKPKPKTK